MARVYSPSSCRPVEFECGTAACAAWGSGSALTFLVCLAMIGACSSTDGGGAGAGASFCFAAWAGVGVGTGVAFEVQLWHQLLEAGSLPQTWTT
jgi:hypothetical protein